MSSDDFAQLAGKRAVVTGSTSGLGRAIALQLAMAGADVLIHGRARRAEATRVAEAIAAMGRRTDVVLLDLADPENHERLIDAAWRWADGVEIWVNNAGADVLTESAADWSFAAKLEHLWRVDVMATIALSRAAGRRMQAASPASASHVILNMGWDQAQWGMNGDSGQLFATVKGAVMAFTRSLARSLAPQVRVNCLAPGWIQTAWGRETSAYWQQRARREALLERWGTPQDVAGLARFLVSPAADFITGQIIPVNGGFRGPAE